MKTIIRLQKGILVRIATLLIFSGFFQQTLLASSVITIEGVYQGKNVFIKNPVIDHESDQYGIIEAEVNGEKIENIHSGVFEIDLSHKNLKYNARLEILLRCRDGCKPKLLNPESVYPHPAFETVSIAVNENGLVKWETKNELGALPYYIEQYKWGRWVTIGEVQGQGATQNNCYTFQAMLNSGENLFRVKQVDFQSRTPRYSEEVRIKANSPAINFHVDKRKGQILFNHSTNYELYDLHGILLATGCGDQILVGEMKHKTFYLNYGSMSVKLCE